MNDTTESTEAPNKTRAESARVQSEYETLDSDATKAAYEELDSVLDGLAERVIHTIAQITPHMAKMQSLLSQRGKARKTVLKEAGLPSWTEYGQAYAAKLECSFRTIQDHITGLRRNGKSGPSQSTQTGQRHKRNGDTRRSTPWHANAKDSRQLAKAQLAINELIATYESDGDLEPAYLEYKKVAVSPEKLNVLYEATSSESSKADVDAEVKKRLAPVVETAERYIRALERLLYSPGVTLTEEQKKTLQKPTLEWRNILRYARGQQAEMTGKGVSKEDVPIVFREVA